MCDSAEQFQWTYLVGRQIGIKVEDTHQRSGPKCARLQAKGIFSLARQTLNIRHKSDVKYSTKFFFSFYYRAM